MTAHVPPHCPPRVRGQVQAAGFDITTGAHFFDTVKVQTGELTAAVKREAESRDVNLRYFGDDATSFTLDETVEADDILLLSNIFRAAKGLPPLEAAPLVTRAAEYPEHLKVRVVMRIRPQSMSGFPYCSGKCFWRLDCSRKR